MRRWNCGRWWWIGLGEGGRSDGKTDRRGRDWDEGRAGEERRGINPLPHAEGLMLPRWEGFYPPTLRRMSGLVRGYSALRKHRVCIRGAEYFLTVCTKGRLAGLSEREMVSAIRP